MTFIDLPRRPSLTGSSSVPSSSSIDRPTKMETTSPDGDTKNDPTTLVTPEATNTNATDGEGAGGDDGSPNIARSIASRDRKLRKRLNMIESERDRARTIASQFPKIIKDHSHHHHHGNVSVKLDFDEEDEEEERHESRFDDATGISDRVADMRRRRVFQTHYHRPFPTPTQLSSTKPKKKFKFWDVQQHQQLLQTHQQQAAVMSPFRGVQKSAGEVVRQRFEQYTLTKCLSQQEETLSLSFPMIQKSSSFSYSQQPHEEHDFSVDWIHPSACATRWSHLKLLSGNTTTSRPHQTVAPRVLWSAAGSSGGAVSSSFISNNDTHMIMTDSGGTYGSHFNRNDQHSRLDLSKDEIMDGLVYEDDEIMTPVKPNDIRSIFNFSATSSEDCEDDDTRDGTAHTSTISFGNPNSFMYITQPPVFQTPQKSTVNTGTKSSFSPSFLKVGVNPAVTPQNNRLFTIDAPSYDHPIVPQVTPPNAPRKEAHHPKFHRFGPSEEDYDEIEAVAGLAKVDGTPIASSPVPFPKMDIQQQKFRFPRNRSDSVDGERNNHDMIGPNVSSTGSILWQSLFQDDKGHYCTMGADEEDKLLKAPHSTLEALADGATLQKQYDGNNTVKLFVDKYHKTTFERIVDSLKELTSITTLIICRGLDILSPTYRSPAEMKELLASLCHIEDLESLMILNFGPELLIDLAMALNHHPSVYRLQIHMAEGTLNGELLGVLATSPRLTHLQVEAKESCAVGTLMNSRSLRSLHLTSDSIQLENSHLQTLICGLRNNHMLTSLDLAPTISVEQFRSLCHALKDNGTLECLRVSLRAYSAQESSIVATALSGLFKVNTTLTTVWNFTHEYCLMDEHSKYVVMSSLKRNATVRHFKFFSENADVEMLTPGAPEDEAPPGEHTTGHAEKISMFFSAATGDELMGVMGCVGRSSDVDTEQEQTDDFGFETFASNLCDSCDAHMPLECLQDSVNQIGEAFKKLAKAGSPDSMCPM